MDGITVITTEAITIDITIAATTTGTEDGLSRSMDAPGITAIGKQYRDEPSRVSLRSIGRG